MAGRSLLDLVVQMLDAKKGSAGMTPRERAMAIRDIERASGPVTRLPRAGADTMVVRGLPPSQQPVKKVLDPLGYGGVKLTRPIEAYSPTVTATNMPLLPRQMMSLEDIEGSYLLPLYGDRSSAAGLLSRVGDVDLQRKYLLEGGADFMRGLAYQLDRAIWASGSGVMKPIVSRAEEVFQKTGRPVYGVTMSMAPDALDFAKFTPRVAVDLMQQAMTKKAAQAFDQELRTKKDMANWPGVLSQDVDAWLQTAAPKQQKAFMRFADTDEAKAQFGVPPDVIAAARYAVTDPTQAALRSGYGGVGISRFDTSGGGLISSPRAPHSSYSTQARGEYRGSLPIPVPQEVLFREAFQKYFSPNYISTKGDKGALSPANATYAAKTQLPAQLVDAEMVDTYMQLLEDARSLGLLQMLE